MTTPSEEMVALIEEAMMCGWTQIMSNKSLIQNAYSGATGQSGADLLRAALDGFALDFATTRTDLIEAAVAGESS